MRLRRHVALSPAPAALNDPLLTRPVSPSASNRYEAFPANGETDSGSAAWAIPGEDISAMDLRDALDALGEITGEVTSADILNTMFASFCVGK